MINSSKNQIINLDDLNNLENVDAILVLGCKAYDDRPSLMLAKRLDKALRVYEKIPTKFLLSGDHGQKEYDEVDIMADYMINEGIKTEDIFLDHAGFSTYDSLYRAKYVFLAKKVIIITQRYHMHRALYIAKALDIETVGVVADDIPQKGVMLKNQMREILSRDKNFFKAIFKPQSKYLGEKISLSGTGNVKS